MNHDANHCTDYLKSKCPKRYYRAQLTQDLNDNYFTIWKSTYIFFRGEKNVEKTIGKKIKELRKKNNLSQDKLGELVACDRQKIADWERNKSKPKIEYIIKLSKIFNVSSDYLLGLSEVPNQLNTDDEKALRVSCDYTGLSPNVARYFSSHKEDYNLKVVIEFFVEYLKKHKNCVKGM